MEKADWQDMKKKFKKVFDRSMKALKVGGEEAKFVANQTAHALQVEMDIYGLRHRITKTTQKFGDSVHKVMSNGKIVTTAEIRKMAKELSSMKSTLKRKEQEMRRLHLTRTKGTKKKGKARKK